MGSDSAFGEPFYGSNKVLGKEMNLTPQEKALELIIAERQRQDEKWGFPQNNTPFEWVSILTEEVGEFAQATNDAYLGCRYFPGIDKVREEAVHAAAVALSIIEHLPEPYNIDWASVKEHLDSAITIYENIPTGALALHVIIYPLRERFVSGERTRELYDEILEIEL